MNSKWHLITSILKSVIRIVGCIIGVCLKSVSIVGGSIVIAELLGIAEELGDKR